MPCPLLIFSQSDYLIQIVNINTYTEWQTVQIQISWLLQKPTDLDLHCLQWHGISRFSRTRVNTLIRKHWVGVKLVLYSTAGGPSWHTAQCGMEQMGNHCILVTADYSKASGLNKQWHKNKCVRSTQMLLPSILPRNHFQSQNSFG